ncbi:NTE family protein [Salsuginibacillus halophilus]|uniref:NTE family protein n=1 Tax=Salsuginibacillus halophilus TaxID=517424 RepID=A0A2P8HX61_9BACI|nr:patatin-like phospholipase family protein [Salsuginibacillus halophilus]PSL50788.1 NTE family protein [Salsuginibacillus halophilus]
MAVKVGLALGSGGSRGLAHIGVLKAFEEEGIPVDAAAGSSMGGLVAALYGVGHDADQLKKLALMFRRKYYIDVTVPRMGFVSGVRIKQLLRMLAKERRLEDLDRPTTVVAADLKSGERVKFTKGPLETAVRASIAIPGIFVPEMVDGRPLVDGGVIDRVPAGVVKEMGIDITVAVDVSFFNAEAEISSIYDVMMQSMEIMGRELLKHREIDADIMIRPVTSYYHAFSFAAVEELIELGYTAAMEQMPAIRKALKRAEEENKNER